MESQRGVGRRSSSSPAELKGACYVQGADEAHQTSFLVAAVGKALLFELILRGQRHGPAIAPYFPCSRSAYGGLCSAVSAGDSIAGRHVAIDGERNPKLLHCA